VQETARLQVQTLEGAFLREKKVYRVKGTLGKKPREDAAILSEKRPRRAPASLHQYPERKKKKRSFRRKEEKRKIPLLGYATSAVPKGCLTNAGDLESSTGEGVCFD